LLRNQRYLTKYNLIKDCDILMHTIRTIVISIHLLLGSVSTTCAHSGGLNKQGCHAGSQPYHCHRNQTINNQTSVKPRTKITGIVTHVRDGDTIEINETAIRLSALNCPENGTQKGNYATRVAKQFEGMKMTCELTGAKTYDRLVGYCSVNGMDFGKYMMQNSSCKVWEKYDVWDRY